MGRDGSAAPVPSPRGEGAAAGRYFGLDAAWSDANPSGACVLDGNGAVLEECLLADDAAIVDWIAAHLDGPAVVGADLPLHVPNPEGARPGDRALISRYGSRGAGPHPANRSLFLRRYGRIRGEDLAAALAGFGFAGPWDAGDRTLLEVYPHPGLIEVFDLPERLRYKRGPLADRRRGLLRLRRLLATLADADPPLVGPPVPIPRSPTGRQAKAIEDRLDARFCAWTALRWATHGTRGVELFGDPASGHIAVPVTRHLIE